MNAPRPAFRAPQCIGLKRMVLCFAAVLVSGTLFSLAVFAQDGGSTTTKFLKPIAIPGNAIRSFDISWVDSERGLYFLADRSNSGVDIFSTETNKWIGRAGGFKGIALNPDGTVNNNLSGPDGDVSRGNCLFAGDGDSTLKTFDISDPTSPQPVGSPFDTGGGSRVDEMALSADGKFLIAANNAADPPFATLFSVDPESCSFSKIAKIEADSATIPPGAGLSIEQPTWVEATQRFIVSVPTIANNSFDPSGCNYGQNPGPVTCSGAVLVIDPTNLASPIEKVVSLYQCGPNGATVGPHNNVMVGCTPGNQPSDHETTVINAKTFRYVDVGDLTGSDEVWYNAGSNRYYTGSSRMPGGAVLGVVDGTTNFLLQTIPQSSASHSVAADSERNEIFVPQAAPKAVVGPGGDATGPTHDGIGGVGDALCGGTQKGCIAVFVARGED